MPEVRATTQVLAILNVLLSDLSGDWYGLELTRAAGLKTGTVYPILARLEKAGWLTSRWEDVDPAVAGRPRRRMYRLSGEGQRNGSALLAEHRELLAPKSAPARGGWMLNPGKGTA
ncbi:MAG TPA: PadR family transcriptional regulator [Baekduia sp.]